MNIYVGNLAYTVTEDEVGEVFSAYGDVTSAKLITDKFSGQSKGFAFVEMANNSEADNAIKQLNGTVLTGRNITVKSSQAARGTSVPRFQILIPSCWSIAWRGLVERPSFPANFKLIEVRWESIS
jgi:RNA recognition motif-containing protein